MTEEQGAGADGGNGSKNEVEAKDVRQQGNAGDAAQDSREIPDSSKNDEPSKPNLGTGAPTDLEKKIIRQIEYYFGDINLGRDKFLQEKIKEDNGWVPLATMLKFNRLAALTEDTTVVINSLAKSETGLLEINEDRSKIRRSPNKPLPEMNEKRRKELMVRTLYIKGFSREDLKLDDLLDFFQNHSVDNVIVRHFFDRAIKTWLPKGSAFVTFKTIDAAESYLKLENVKYKDNDLLRMWQSDYIEEKRKERLGMKNKNKKNDEGNGDLPEETDRHKERGREILGGCIVRISDLKPEMQKDDIKKAIEKFGFPVAFVDIKRGDGSGWVRLDEQDSAKELTKKLTSEGVKLKVDNVEITVETLTEEEEASYNKKLKEIFSRNWTPGGRPKKKGGRGRGGWNSRKRKGNMKEDGGPPAKVKVE